MNARTATLALALAAAGAGFIAKPIATSGPALRDFESYYAAGATWRYHGDAYGREVWRVERTVPGVVAARDEVLPFVGPPFGLPLWGALAQLGWSGASAVWEAILALALGVLALGSLRLAGGRIDAFDVAAVLAFAAGFGPLTSGIALGQVAIVSCAAIVLTPLLLRQRYAFAPAAGALVAALQPNLGIVLAARAYERRAWIAFAFALALAAGGSAVALAGSGGLGHYFEVLQAHSASERFIAIQTTIAAVARGFGAPAGASGALALAVALGALGLLAWQFAARPYCADDRLTLACAALPLVLPFAHEHDFTIAFLPVVLAVRRARGAAWVAAAVASMLVAVDWLGLAQRPGGTLETVLLTTGAALGLAALARGPLRPYHYAPLLVVAGVLGAAQFVSAHSLPTWPDALPAHFQLPPALGAAGAWQWEQVASGVAGLDPHWALLRALSLAGCALIWGVASVVLLASRTEVPTRESFTPRDKSRTPKKALQALE